MFAKAIGMDLQFDTENVWLLNQALTTELPGEYKMFVNPDDKAYYVKFDENDVELSVSFEHPLVPAYKEIFEKMLRDQQDAQNVLAGATEDPGEGERQEAGEAEGEGGDEGGGGGQSLTKAQEKKIRMSRQDALLHYKKVLGDPDTDDVGPKEDAAKTFWDVHPDDVEDLAEYMEIDLDTEQTLMWIPRMASCVELPPGWTEHAPDSEVAHLRSTLVHDGEEPGVCYTYEKWLCRNDRETALMALDDHPSEEYYKEVLGVCREELKEAMEDSMGGDDGLNVVPEYVDEDGSVYTFDHQTREKTKTGRVLDLEAIQQALHGDAEAAEKERLAEEEAQRMAEEAAIAAAEAEKAEKASNMTPFERLLEKLKKKGLLEKQVVDFATLIGINPKNDRSDFLWLIDQGLSKPLPGWVYRADPNGKWHYYSANSGAVARETAKAKGGGGAEGTTFAKISGWEADMEKSLGMGGPGANKVQSVWTHPRAKFYKNLHTKLQKKRRLEGREQLAAKLLQESTEDHLRRKHRGRQTGGVGVAHMAPREGDEDTVTQPTIWSMEEKTHFNVAEDVAQHEKEARDRPLHPGFASPLPDKAHEGAGEGGGTGPFQDAKFDAQDTAVAQKKVKRPNNKPGDGRRSRGGEGRSSDDKGFTGLAIDATLPTSPTRVLKNENGADNVLYMEPPRMGALHNMAPQPNRSVSAEPFGEHGGGKKRKKKKKKSRKDKRRKEQRSNTVMGMAGEEQYGQVKPMHGANEDSEEDFSLLEDEEIKAALKGDGENDSWSMNTNTKVSLKPLGSGLPFASGINFDDAHPLEKISTPDIGRKRFQPAKLSSAEPMPHPLLAAEKKLSGGARKGNSSLTGPVLGSMGSSLAPRGNFLPGPGMAQEEPFSLPSPREKRKRFTPAILPGGLGAAGRNVNSMGAL